MSRIVLCIPGEEILLFRYKREVPDKQALSKMAVYASEFFDSWEWSKDLPAIESGNKILLLLKGPSAKECFL